MVNQKQYSILFNNLRSEINKRSIENICDFIIEDNKLLNRYVGHKEFILDRVINALIDRLENVTNSLIANINDLCSPNTYKNKYGDKSNMHQLRILFQVRNMLNNLL